MAESYIAQAVIGPDPEQPKQRKAGEVARTIEKEFISVWGGARSPTSMLTMWKPSSPLLWPVAHPAKRAMCSGSPKACSGGRPGRSGCSGLRRHPAAISKPSTLSVRRSPLIEIFNDTEIAVFWRNAGRLGHPHGSVYKLLLLTGLRLNECADAVWSEFDFKAKLWTIPKERMKGTHEKARAHTVPLTDDMLTIIEKLPRFKSGDFLFSIPAARRRYG